MDEAAAESSDTRLGVLAYGPDSRIHAECCAAILSVLAHAPAALRCTVLTDQPSRYRWFEDAVTIEGLSEARISAWQGERRDRFRPKIEALRWLASGAAAHAMLIDCDTLARRPLQSLLSRLDAGAFVLYRREYSIGAPPRKGDRALRTEIAGRTWNGIPATAETAMWNGGVIGCGRRHPTVPDQVLEVFDRMRRASRHFAIEQLAYSVVFEHHGDIVEAAPWFDHYWANRTLYRRKIEQALLDMLMTQLTVAEAATRFREHPVVAPLDGRPSRWERTIQRLAASLAPQKRSDD